MTLFSATLFAGSVKEIDFFIDTNYHQVFVDKKSFEQDLGMQLSKKLNQSYSIFLYNEYKNKIKKYEKKGKPLALFVINGFSEVIDQYLVENQNRKCKEHLAFLVKNNKFDYSALLAPMLNKITTQLTEIKKKKGRYRIYWIGGKLSGQYLFFDRLKCLKEEVLTNQASDAYVHFLDYMAINKPDILVSNYLNIDNAKKKRPSKKISQSEFVSFMSEGLSPFLVDTF